MAVPRAVRKLKFGQRESSRGSIDRKEVSINAIRTSLRSSTPKALAQSKFQFASRAGYTIGLAGDVMIGRTVNDILSTAPPKYIWGDLLSLLHSSDFNLVNLEAALTHNVHTLPKRFNFKSDPRNVQALLEGAIHAVNLANNHVLDYSEEGLVETLETLNKAHIQHVGAGKNSIEAMAPAIFQCRDLKIGVIGCTDNEETWQASALRSGTFYLEVGDLDTIREPILNLRSQVDLMILSIHWGPNMMERPTDEFKEFAHKLIDAGVDIIHGHSAHLFQGVEVYNRKLILYDTGDFVDDYAVDPLLRNDRSFYFQVEVDKDGIRSLRMTPVVISNFQVNKAKGTEAQEINQRMQHLSKELLTPLQFDKDQLFLDIKK